MICAALATPVPIPLKPGLTPLPGPTLFPGVDADLAGPAVEALTGGLLVAPTPIGLLLAIVDVEAVLAVLPELAVLAVDLPNGATPGRGAGAVVTGFRAVGTKPAEAFRVVL